MEPALLPELLMRLEAAMVEAGAPVLARLRQGLPADVVRARLAEIGISAPDEVVTWFGWHDGEADVPGSGSLGLCPALSPWTFEQSIERRAHLLRVDPEGFEDQPGWLPLLGYAHGADVLVDCSGPPEATCPTAYYENEMDPDIPPAPSFTEVVSWWVKSYETGRWVSTTWGATVRDESFPLHLNITRSLLD